MTKQRICAAIDLKSFYASAECVERGLDPLDTNLVVADGSRTEKTICLAVSPSLKARGIPGRARLFEVVRKVKEINALRLAAAPGGRFRDASVSARELDADPSLELDYITAPPRMSLYMEYSTRVYGVYLKYVAPEDMHVYSVDEVFIDITDYLRLYGQTPVQFVKTLLRAVLAETGITAAAGIGTNLYLAKAAMDIGAKHVAPDGDGDRICELDELSYRRLLWTHMPLTDFWRVGKGYARRLNACGLYTMGDIARCSLGRADEYYNEDLLYRMFGVNAELLIDHAWGREPVTIADIKAYRPETRSLSRGQVLAEPYPFGKARLVLREMADALALEMAEKGLCTDQLVLTVCYDVSNLSGEDSSYDGEVVPDFYGRPAPKPGHGTINLDRRTSSPNRIMDAAAGLFDRITDRRLLVRRMYLGANRVAEEETGTQPGTFEQMELFRDFGEGPERREQEEKDLEREKRIRQFHLDVRRRFGKNAVVRGMDLLDGATAMERNRQIGGHRGGGT